MSNDETTFASGGIDEPFGGSSVDAFAAPQRKLQDSQAREMQSQERDAWWSGRPVQRLPMSTSGQVGDAVVFDATAARTDGAPTFRVLAQGGFLLGLTPVIGLLLDFVSAGAVARVCPGGGVLASVATGLSAASKGPIAVDLTTGRLRIASEDDEYVGYCDGNGNCYLLPMVTSIGFIYGRATFSNSTSAFMAWSSPVSGGSYYPLIGQAVVLDGGGNVAVAADGTTQTAFGITVNSDAAFSGYVDGVVLRRRRTS